MSFYENFSPYDECAPPGVLLPKISIEDKYYKQVGISNASSNLQFLKKLCSKSMRKKGFTSKDKKYIDRMKMEISIFEELGFVDYILLNWEVLNFCHENNRMTRQVQNTCEL